MVSLIVSSKLRHSIACAEATAQDCIPSCGVRQATSSEVNLTDWEFVPEVGLLPYYIPGIITAQLAVTKMVQQVLYAEKREANLVVCCVATCFSQFAVWFAAREAQVVLIRPVSLVPRYNKQSTIGIRDLGRFASIIARPSIALRKHKYTAT